mmetsp:Transcript_9727/g.21777  ORF Transcript_9727/g.21777 Transcript_9727/m.21777 type:complete len:457 (-) Transcript_9727:199-1569(-)
MSCPAIDAALKFPLPSCMSENGYEQRFAVMRHAERADCWGNTDWYGSEDMQRWPSDPPLTQGGITSAQQVGRQLAAHFGCRDLSAYPLTVASSPYFRCVQTAVELCRAVGPGSKILLDNELGEVFGYEAFGDFEPQIGQVTRSMEEILAYCQLNGVEVEVQKVGRQPQWPESMPQARLRLICRFLHYLEESHRVHRDFILVTHAEGVTSALSALPSMRRTSMNKVDYCGYILGMARRLTPTLVTSTPSKSSVEQSSSDDDMSPGQARWLPSCLKSSAGPPSPGIEQAPLHKFQSPRRRECWEEEGWVMKQFNVEVEDSDWEPWTPKIRRWSGRCKFSEDRIRRLLRLSSTGTTTPYDGCAWSSATSSWGAGSSLSSAFFSGPAEAWEDSTLPGNVHEGKNLSMVDVREPHFSLDITPVAQGPDRAAASHSDSNRFMRKLSGIGSSSLLLRRTRSSR